MTEERKQELRRLLRDAIDCLDIRPKSESTPKSRLIDKDEYRIHLHRHWESYPEESSWFLMSFEPCISSYDTKSRLLDFIREELAPFIHNDRMLTASHFLIGGLSEGFPLERLLTQLLKIAIVRGTEGAVSELDRCTKDNRGFFKYLVLLEGIRLEKEIEVCDGVRLVPLTNVEAKLPSYLKNVSSSNPIDFSLSPTLLVIDCYISPIFHKPFEATTMQEYEELENRTFRVEVDGRDSAHFRLNDSSVDLLRQALSFTCNFPVRVSFVNTFLDESELFNLSFGMSGGTYWSIGKFGESTKVGEAQINEFKQLYSVLKKNPEVRKALRIPFDRWVESKAGTNPVDKMIDLGIALEALYVPDSREGEITFKLAVRAAWFLGKDEADREKLLPQFKAIYKQRSNLVHGGELKDSVKIGGESISTTGFIEIAQDLCRRSILEAMNRPRFTEKGYWDSLVLGS